MRSLNDQNNINEGKSIRFFEGVIEDYGWKYRRQEKDNDIDGEIEVFSEEGETTAKIIKVQTEGKKVKESEGLHFCNQLYSIARELKHVSPTERYEQRLKKSRPILDLFSAWLYEQKDRVLPKSALEGHHLLFESMESS